MQPPARLAMFWVLPYARRRGRKGPGSDLAIPHSRQRSFAFIRSDQLCHLIGIASVPHSKAHEPRNRRLRLLSCLPDVIRHLLPQPEFSTGATLRAEPGIKA